MSTKPSYVTSPILKKELKKLDQKIDSVAERLDQKIDSAVVRLSSEILGMDVRLKKVEENMATKSDIDRVLSQMTDFAKQTQLVLQNQEVHRGYIHDHEARLISLEKSLAS